MTGTKKAPPRSPSTATAVIDTAGVPAYWAEAAQALSGRDPVLARIIVQSAHTRMRLRSDAFQALARAIVGQQISVKAAQSVWDRLVACVDHCGPSQILALDAVALRAAGLSGQKSRYLQDLAHHFASGAINPLGWAGMDDEQVIVDLVRVKGIGRWTAEMFLIFHLQRPDVLPVDDLGLQKAISLHYNRGRTLTEKRLRKIAQPWAPWRTVATWYLWRSLEPVPVEY